MTPNRCKTKIIATIGPSSSSKDVMRQMFQEGVNVCRINLSHGTHADHAKVIKNIRELNAELDMDVAILADLQGPKIRIGEVENNEIVLENERTVKFVITPCLGTADKLFINYTEFPADVEVGHLVLIDDGKIKLEVIDTNRRDTVIARVLHGGTVSSRKGVNLPNTHISQSSLTPKDVKDLDFILEQDVDWVALSFVRTMRDIVELKEFIRERPNEPFVIAKIEKPEALENIDAIIDVSDGIMIARGDLGVEVEFEKVPLIQKEIVEKCIKRSKPVIIATQMLDSMVNNFRPTRAEATDVANAVLDGADTLMLSNETSTGKYPIESLQAMHRIIEHTEATAYKYNRGTPPKQFSLRFLADSICFSATRMADFSNAKGIVNFSFSGYTAFKLAGYRPKANIYVFTSNKNLISRMSLVWGIKTMYYDKWDNIDPAITDTISILVKKGEINTEDIVIHVASTPLQQRHRTNMLKISYMA